MASTDSRASFSARKQPATEILARNAPPKFSPSDTRIRLYAYLMTYFCVSCSSRPHRRAKGECRRCVSGFIPLVCFVCMIFGSHLCICDYSATVLCNLDVIRALPRLDDSSGASQHVQVIIGDENVFINRLLLSIEKILNRGLRGTTLLLTFYSLQFLSNPSPSPPLRTASLDCIFSLFSSSCCT